MRVTRARSAETVTSRITEGDSMGAACKVPRGKNKERKTFHGFWGVNGGTPDFLAHFSKMAVKFLARLAARRLTAARHPLLMGGNP